MNSKILKLASVYICEPLQHIFNYCIDNGVFPDDLKYVKVIPIYKKGDRLDLNNYRPISIVPTVSKVFEIVLNQQIVHYFENHSLFNHNQYGFHAGRSTTDALINFIKNCFSNLESNNMVISRFFDLTRAFDTISQDIILDKLSFYGFDVCSVNLLKSYLNRRFQSVFINDKFSQFL